MDNSQLVDALVKEASRIQEDANYTGKAHLNAATIWSNRHYFLGAPATIAGVLAGAAIVKDCQMLAGLLSLAATILTSLVTFLKPFERSSQHKSLGDQFLSLRNDARVFGEIEVLATQDVAALTKTLKALSARRNDLNKGSPAIPRCAFKQAQAGIEAGESLHQVDTVK